MLITRREFGKTAGGGFAIAAGVVSEKPPNVDDAEVWCFRSTDQFGRVWKIWKRDDNTLVKMELA